MARTVAAVFPPGRRPRRSRWLLRFAAVGAVLGSLLAVAPGVAQAATASDSFNRVNGALGSNWTKISDGALTLSNQAVAGTAVSGTTGDLWTASTFSPNQYSQITTTATALSGGQWIGVAVRANSTGQQAYVGVYFWNSGTPDLRLYRRSGGTWNQLGATYHSGVLPSGTQLQLMAVGSTISLLQNGVSRISVTDTTLTSGAPGIIAFGKSTADNWAGGDTAAFTVGGSVSGLTGSVVLQDNGGDDLTVSASGPFTFATKVATGGAYAVTVKTQPSGQNCTVASGSGTMGSANVTNVAVTCAAFATYSVGGTVTGLSGAVVLQDNGGDNLTVSASGPFTFATKLAGGAAYAVTVQSSPAGQSCVVTNGSGTIAAANVTNVAVNCTATAPGSGSDDFNRANGGLGANWANISDGGLTISGQAVAGTAAAGVTGDLRTAETYQANQFSQVTVTATKLSGGQWIGPVVRANGTGQQAYAGLYFWNSGSPELMLFKRLSGNWTQIGSAYNSGPLSAGDKLQLAVTGSKLTFLLNGAVRISATDTSLTSGAPGIMAYGTGSVDNWSGGVPSDPSSYTVGGSVSGLTGTVVLQDNGGDDLSVTANGPFTFATPVAAGSGYAVTVKTQPSGQTCTVGSGIGTVSGANVTSVTVSCATSSPGTFTVGGTLSGLSGTVVLQDNGGDDLSLTANGPFTFATGVASGSPYAVTVKTQPSGQTCTVTGGTGTVNSANVTNVAVACAASTGNQIAADSFNRANGSLGAGWTDISDGGLVISSQAAAGATGGALTGDTRTGETYPGDQYSQVSTTSAQLSGGQWIGPSVRSQNSGQDAYVGIYYWNNGSPDLMLFKRLSGGWTQIGTTYASGALAAGTVLQLSAVGSTITFSQNGVSRISVTDTSLTGGAPGIQSFGTGSVDNWSGGSAVAGPPPPSYTVGGTASGLTGSLVLQDNGTDNLTVSASGSFTFATALPSGSNYNVTVRSSPTGQSCTVSNATGTITANVTNVSVNCTTGQPTSGTTDGFNRADGSLGAGWTDFGEGGMAISSQVVTGTGSGVSGDIRTGETYAGNQYSQVEVTSTQLTGSQFIGAGVRMQNGGQDGYVGIYSWNGGSPELMIFERNGGNFSQLGDSYSTAPLAAGTQLKIEVVGSTIALMANGVERVAVGNTDLAGGAPGMIAFGTATADNWAGGTQGFEMHYLSTDANGIASYDIISASDSDGPHVVRVLKPTNPAAGVSHNFLFVLPVEPELGNQFGDGLQVMRGLGAQNQYNLTIVEPSFGIDPWYADSPADPSVQYETFMTKELVPWVQANLGTSGSEQNWLIGFSKSGIGGQDLILKNPGVFQLAASWDFPADMASYDAFGGDSAAGYGTDANFQANYRLTQAFVDAHKGPFVTSNRIWIGGYGLYQQDDSDYDALLTTEGIKHTTETPTAAAHTWTSGWVPGALAALHQDSMNLP